MSALDVMRRVLTAYETHDLLGMEAHMQELRGAIAELETQEHSIEIRVYGQTVTFVTREPMAHYKDGDRFYRHPPQRQPLTDEQLKPIADEYRILFGGWVVDFARAIERKHGIGGGE